MLVKKLNLVVLRKIIFEITIAILNQIGYNTAIEHLYG